MRLLKSSIKFFSNEEILKLIRINIMETASSTINTFLKMVEMEAKLFLVLSISFSFKRVDSSAVFWSMFDCISKACLTLAT